MTDVVFWERFCGRIVHAAHLHPLPYHTHVCVVHRLQNLFYNRFLVELSVNGSLGLRIVLSGTSSAVNGLAVDWAAGNLYWTDGLYRWIAVTRVARRGAAAAAGHKTLVSMDVEQPYGIAVWPHRGFVAGPILSVFPH